MTMSISSAPASTAARVSAILMSRNVWPDGKPVATEATLTVEPFERVLRVGDQRRVDADRRDRRDRRVARLRVHRLRAEGPDLARACPSPRGSSDPSSGSRGRAPRASTAFLIERFFSAVDPLLDADLVDRADPAEQAAERARPAVPRADELVGALAGERVRASGGGHGTVRIHRASGASSASGRLAARPRTFGSGGRPRLPSTRKWRNQSRTTLRFSARRNGVPDRVSSWVSSGTRRRRTGRFCERRTVNSASAWPIVVRMSFSLCWIRSGVLIRVGVGDRRDLAEVGRVLPRASSGTRPRPEAAADVAGQEQQRHVAHGAAGHRRGEPLVVAEDPVRQVAAVRAAGDAEPVGIGQAIGDERRRCRRGRRASGPGPSRGCSPR